MGEKKAVNLKKLREVTGGPSKGTKAQQRGEVSQPVERAPRGPGVAYRGERFDSLGDLLGAGLPVKIVLRDTGFGVTFTIKVVFSVSQAPIGMYMHGSVKQYGMVPEVIDRLLQKGDWHVDRYFVP